MHADAVIITGNSLKAFIGQHRGDLREFYLDVRRELRGAIEPEFLYGRKQGPHSLLVKENANPHLSMMIDSFAAALPEYAISGVELWFGGGHVIPEHNDALLFLSAGRVRHLQFWVLLEACVRDGAQYTDSDHKDALECLVPAAPGPKIVELEDVLTPSGFVRYSAEKVIGGDALSIGDMLLFKNGVIHRKPRPRLPGIFRVALAFRCIRTVDKEVADDRYLAWLKKFLADNVRIATALRESRNEYIRELLDLTEAVAAQDLKLTSFVKEDTHDFDSIMQKLSGVDIAGRKQLSPAGNVSYLSH